MKNILSKKQRFFKKIKENLVERFLRWWESESGRRVEFELRKFWSRITWTVTINWYIERVYVDLFSCFFFSYLILKYVPSLLDIDYTLYEGMGEDPREAERRAANRRRVFYTFVLIFVWSMGVFFSWVVRKFRGTVDKGGWAVRELDQIVVKRVVKLKYLWGFIKQYLKDWFRSRGGFCVIMFGTGGGSFIYKVIRRLKFIFVKIRGWWK